jgi:hypothetical protein
MAECLPGTGRRDANTSRLVVRISPTTICVMAGFAVPLERHRVTIDLARVEFHEHEWFLSGFGEGSV